MPNNEYHFITHWRVEGTINEVADILKAADELPRWWPSVYLNVKVLEPGRQGRNRQGRQSTHEGMAALSR